MSGKREIDDVTGAETTGHEWDGIKELNMPIPSWWTYAYAASIVWAIGYWIAYPAWPTFNDYTRGVLGYSQRVTVAQELKAAQTAQGGMRDLLAKTPIAAVRENQDLLRFSIAGGNAAFQTNCAPCHGRGAQGFTGYPNLNDDDWLWGGTIDDVYKSIRVGIRSDHKEARTSQMPRYGLDGMFIPAQVADVTEHVIALGKSSHDAPSAARGAVIFKEQCVACHGDSGTGNIEQGAPNLTDGIWLYGGSREAINESIRTGRGGAMPAWADRLDPTTLKALAVYVHSLGGGK